MAIKIAPELEPPAETRPAYHRFKDWFTRLRRRVKVAMDGNEEELLVVNNTIVSWHVYHKFHLLGILDPGESRLFRLRKQGNVNARPDLQSDAVEYLVLDLNSRIQRIEIYRRRIGPAVDTYDMRAA